MTPGSFDHPNDPNRPDLTFCSWPITLMSTPESVQAYFQAGRDLRKQGNNSAAIAHFRAALALQPEHLPSLNNLANALQATGNTDAALALLQQALEIAPGKAVLHCNLGSLWQLLKQPETARAAFERAIALQPELALAHHNLAKLALAEGWLTVAKESFRQALLLQPGNAELHLDYGDACQRFGASQRAVEHYRLATRLAPSARAYNCLGIALQALGKLDLARTSYLRALKLDPESTSTPINLAQLHERQGDLDAARALYEALLARHPDDTRSHLQLAALYRKQADWPSAAAHHEALCRALDKYLQQDDPEPLPLLHAMAMPLPARQVRPLAERIATHFKKQAAALDIRFAPPTDPAPQRLRIGYLSPDFRDHAVGSVILGLFRHHQRDAFETFAYSLLTPPNDPWTEQLRSDFDHFHDVSLATPVELARRIHADDIHILVDLAGYTTECRPLVLALKPAPVQIQYLGYPGSMGADFVPWVVADELLIPPEHEDQYVETVLRLPHGWGAVRPSVPETTRSRSDYGLPTDAMVYCCLNAAYKIEPVVFALWMEILRQVPGSVLWLTDGGRSGSNQRLRQQAQAAGVDPERLLFAGRVHHAEYLARYRLADLFLDTFSYNAGSTALATFAAGLPMLTYPGEHYARRMGASLCQAAGMPELICTSHDEYLRKAIELGQYPERLVALKRTLAERIESAPLFQPERFIAGLEALYRQLWQQWCEANPATAESLV